MSMGCEDILPKDLSWSSTSHCQNLYYEHYISAI
jgi:hypothetical protein